MTMQEVVNAVGFAVFGLMGWFAREMWAAVKELKIDLARLREELPTRYATRSDIEHALSRIDSKLDRISDQLDRKADK